MIINLVQFISFKLDNNKTFLYLPADLQAEEKGYKMGKIITVNIQKGGCGKTTTVQSLACCLKKKGFKCLVIDLDPQLNLTFSSNIQSSKFTLYDLMNDKCTFEDALCFNKYYDILPGSVLLNGADQEITDCILKDILQPIREKYDYIILDTPPSMGKLALNSLYVADYVVIPIEPSFYAFQSLEALYNTINHVQMSYNNNFKILGLLLVKYNKKDSMNKFVCALIERFVKQNNLITFHTKIRESNLISEAQGLQMSVIECSPRSNATIDYKLFTNEVLDIMHQEENIKRIIV